MTPIPDAILSSIRTDLERDLVQALWSAPWSRQSFSSVDERTFAVGTHPGSRRPSNEDRSAVATVQTQAGDRFAVAILCDGVGGSESGDAAATLAISRFLGVIAHSTVRRSAYELVTSALRDTDDFVRRVLRGKGATTASVLVVSEKGDVAAANVGDSRLFSWEISESRIQQVSVDDTMENEFRDMQIHDSEVLDAHGLRGRLSQAIGELGRTSADLRIVVFDRSQFPSGAVIATDGAWKSSEEGFRLIISNAKNALEAIRRTIAFSNWIGGADNVSIIAIENIERLLGIPAAAVDTRKSASMAVWFCDINFLISEAVALPRPPFGWTQAGEQKSRRRQKTKHKRPKEEREENLALGDVNSQKPLSAEPKAEIEVSTDEL